MKSSFGFFLGLFAALALSWAGVVMWPNYQLGRLAPLFDEEEGRAFPLRVTGLAVQGELVYEDLGCATCHTRQVRRPDFGSDKARGWGDRQTVARDYIYDPHVQLGESRIGPDLANVGNRKQAFDADDLYRLLYAGAGGMPPYRFLFVERSLERRQPSDFSVALRGQWAPPPDVEVVATRRARALVAFLLSSSHPYEYPEARPVEPAAGKEAGSK